MFFFLEPASWGAWEEWSSCTQDCGENGTENRTRRCTDNCEGENKKSMESRDNGTSIIQGKCVAKCKGNVKI